MIFNKKPISIITSKPISKAELIHKKTKLYSWVMILRIPPIIAALILYYLTDNRIIALWLIIISVPLPWIAVLFANENSPKKTKEIGPYEEVIRQRELDKLKLTNLKNDHLSENKQLQGPKIN